MFRRLTIMILVLAVSLMVAAPALAGPGQPTFEPALYAGGRAWGTKATTQLPPPNGHNNQSYDGLFAIINSNNPEPQLPVGEAAPGNPAYNGGRWITYTVEWTQAGFDHHGTVPLLMSYADVMFHEGLGHLTITQGSPDPVNGPPDYFQCPLLPVK